MARKKVNVAYIPNDPTRKATGKKRAVGAIKKAGELSVLCGVEACMVIVLEDGTLQAWPSLPEAMATIDRYRSMPEVGRCKKRMDGEGYVRERIAKLQEQLRRAELDNRRRETTLLLHDAMVGRRRKDLDGLTVEQFVGIGWTTENLVNKIKNCIAHRGGQQAAGVKGSSERLPAYDPTVSADVEVEAPHLMQMQPGWVMEVVKAGWDMDTALACNVNGSSSGSGSDGSVAGISIRSDVVGNMDAGCAWADPASYFPHA